MGQFNVIIIRLLDPRPCPQICSNLFNLELSVQEPSHLPARVPSQGMFKLFHYELGKVGKWVGRMLLGCVLVCNVFILFVFLLELNYFCFKYICFINIPVNWGDSKFIWGTVPDTVTGTSLDLDNDILFWYRKCDAGATPPSGAGMP